MSLISGLPSFRLQSISPLRRRFFRDLVLVVLVTAGAVIGVTVAIGTHLRNDLCRTRIAQINIQASHDLERFFRHVETSLDMVRKWGDAGILDTSDVKGLNAKFIPVLESLPRVSTLIIATSEGSGYLLAREADGWLTTVTGPEGPRWQAVHSLWDKRGRLVRRWTGAPAYDPRGRPWYRAAMAAPAGGDVAWTPPYLFADGTTTGVSGAVQWRREGTRRTSAVVAYDVPLDAIFKIVSGIPVVEGGTAFLVASSGEVFASPDRPVSGPGPAPFLMPADRLGKPQITASVASWLEQGRGSNQPLPVTSGSTRWWSCFHLLGEKSFPIWLAVIAPQQALLGEEARGRTVVVFAGVATLGLGILMALLLAFRYSRHLREGHRPVIHRNDPEPGLRALIAMGESATLEFKSTVRMNLKSGKPGKEIELAWLKAVAAFMNTTGGTVLIGVDDRGSLVGVGADGFENDDKCLLHLKNLFSRHIGAEFSRYVSFELYTVEEQAVVMVACERSRQPVFLVTGDDEEFYVRTGPSSVRLSMSRAFKYLASRKGA